MKFKFTKYPSEDNEYNRTQVEMISTAETWTDAIEDFKDFLRGCGYVIKEDKE